MMDYPDLTVSNFMENSIGLKRAMIVNTKGKMPVRLINEHKCILIHGPRSICTVSDTELTEGASLFFS